MCGSALMFTPPALSLTNENKTNAADGDKQE